MSYQQLVPRGAHISSMTNRLMCQLHERRIVKLANFILGPVVSGCSSIDCSPQGIVGFWRRRRGCWERGEGVVDGSAECSEGRGAGSLQTSRESPLGEEESQRHGGNDRRRRGKGRIEQLPCDSSSAGVCSDRGRVCLAFIPCSTPLPNGCVVYDPTEQLSLSLGALNSAIGIVRIPTLIAGAMFAYPLAMYV